MSPATQPRTTNMTNGAPAMDQASLQTSDRSSAKAVVVHGGARDAYQLALALSEHGLLEALVTDLFWPSDQAWATKIVGFLPARVRSMLLQRSMSALPFSQVKLCVPAGVRMLLSEKIPHVPFKIRRSANRASDATLGRTAGKLATVRKAGLVSYSYYGFDAFSHFQRPAILFQVHPHPATVRRILTEELTAHPDCASSLQQEWELALPEEDYQHLVAETTMAAHFLTASTFTRNSLIEHGARASSIDVIPYGVDLDRFKPPTHKRFSSSSTLRLLFVGRINQRKGIKYLLEALDLIGKKDIHLTICGRVVDALDLFRPYASQIDIRPSVSAADLVDAYQQADLFVFPSVAEGFGQVLLESLACGLPVLSTTHTAAPDLIEDGVQGFIIEPRRPDLIAERIDWSLSHRDKLAGMGKLARERAEQFTWQRFRSTAAQAVGNFLSSHPPHLERRA